MSEIIEGLEPPKEIAHETEDSHPLKKILLPQLKKLCAELHIDKWQHKQTINPNIFNFTLIGQNLNSFVQIVIQIQINSQNKQYQIRSFIAAHEETLLVRLKSTRIQTLKFIQKYTASNSSDCCRFALNSQNGFLEINENAKYFQQISFLNKNNFTKMLQQRILEHCQINSKFAIDLLRMNSLLPLNYFQLRFPEKTEQQDSKLTELVKNIALSHIHMALSQQYQESRFPSQSQHLESRSQSDGIRRENSQIYQSLLRGISKAMIFQIGNSNSLFLPFPTIVLREMFDSKNCPSLQQYSRYLNSPQVREVTLNGFTQNKFICNKIQVLNTNNIYLKLENTTGAFSDISLAKIFFQYFQEKIDRDQDNQLGQDENGNQARNGNRIQNRTLGKFQKILALKVAKPRKKDSKRSLQKSKKRINHEKKIIQLLEGASSAYFLKYYLSNQPQFQYDDAILMQYAYNTPNLLDFLDNNAETLSLKIKLVVMAHLSNAMRFLKYYKIVHLDLNLSNVLVMPDGVIKIIDFGESFHPNICDQNYLPGYTLPYSPPEVFHFKENKKMEHQSDIFSYGIILYRFLFGNHAFFPSERLKQRYKEKTYNKHLFCAPQNMSCYGKEKIVKSLLFLCFKCLEGNYELRPIATWITICIRQYISVI